METTIQENSSECGIKAVLQDLKALLVLHERLQVRLIYEVGKLESNPAEAQRQKTLDEIRQDFQDYAESTKALQNMQNSTNTHVTGLLRLSEDTIMATDEEQKGDSEASITSNKLETLLSKTVDDLNLSQKAIARVTSSRKQFVPTRMIALNVIIDDYSELRRLRDFAGFKNLTMLRNDRAKFEQGLKCTGITDVRNLTNPSYAELEMTFVDLKSECERNHRDGEKTYVLVQFGGHGLQDNFTYAMCSTIDRMKIAFPLEQSLRDLIEVENTYIVGLLDCSRVNMPISEVQGKTGEAKGLSAGPMVKEDGSSGVKERDLMIVFACPPNSHAPAVSTLTVGWFQTQYEMSDKVEKVVLLPGNSTAWKPCNNGEVLTLTNHDCVLPFDAELNPSCLKQTTPFMKLKARIQHAAAMSISALRRQVLTKEDTILYNENGDNIIAISPLTKRMELLQPYEPCEPYKLYRTCVVETGLFQIANDSTCRVLLPDLVTRKFAVEQRASVPYEAVWAESTLVALPGSRVMVLGISWGNNKLNPWVYDLKENTWSVMKTPDGKVIPPVPTAMFRITGLRLPSRRPVGDTQFALSTATFFRGKVYLFPSLARQECAGLLCYDILSGSPTDEWDIIPIDQMHGQRPSLVPFSPTELAIVGGHSIGKPRNLCTVVNTVETKARDPEAPMFLPLETRVLPPTSSEPFFTDISINAVRLSDSSFMQINRAGRSYQMSEISLQEELVTVNQIAPIATARSAAEISQEYDLAIPLRRAGISDLTPEQSAAMEAWWRIWIADPESDCIAQLLQQKDLTPGKYVHLKAIFQGIAEDKRSYIPVKPRDEIKALVSAWDYSKDALNFGADQEPPTVQEARLNACRAIQGQAGGFSWSSFKKVHKIISVWYLARRAHHDDWVREKAELNQMEQ